MRRVQAGHSEDLWKTGTGEIHRDTEEELGRVPKHPGAPVHPIGLRLDRIQEYAGDSPFGLRRISSAYLPPS